MQKGEIIEVLRTRYPSLDIFGDHIHIQEELSFDAIDKIISCDIIKLSFSGAHESLWFNLFLNFQELSRSTDWPPKFWSWIFERKNMGDTFPTKIIKVTNLRWLFEKEELGAFKIIFPKLERIIFIEEVQNERSRFCGKPRTTSSEVREVFKNIKLN
jgi:hypothetical protein